MSNAHKFQELDLEDLDAVTGGEQPHSYGVGVTVGIGIGSASVVRMNDGTWYVSGGLSTPSGGGMPRVGASADYISVTPKDGHTVDEVMTGWSTTGAGHVGVGGFVSANDAGKAVGIGVGLDAGVGASYGNNVNETLSPSPGNGAPGDEYHPATTNPDGSINPGSFTAPQAGAETGGGDPSQVVDADHGPSGSSGGTELAGAGGETVDHSGDASGAPTNDAGSGDAGGTQVAETGGSDAGGAQVADAGGSDAGGGDAGGGGGSEVA